MNFRKNRRARSPIEINLLPMIDVVLVLLIFFVVSTTFNHETGIAIHLPEANGDQQAIPADEKMITLLIDKDGQYFVGSEIGADGQLKTQQLTTANLKQGLTAIMGNAPQTPFVISADGKTPHQAVITALDIASQVGFKHIAFATKEQEKTP